MSDRAAPPPIWTPPPALVESSNLTRYARWLERERGLSLRSYEELHAWSVRELDAFWASIWDFCEVRASAPYEAVLAERAMPGARWFPGARLSYAEHALRHDGDGPAIVWRPEDGPAVEVSWPELRRRVGSLAHALRELGVRPGDRVAGYVSNTPEAVVALLAAASVGATWSSCSTDLGAGAVRDRFGQIEPTVLVATDGTRYGGKEIDRSDVVAELARTLPGLRATVLVERLGSGRVPGALRWDDLVAGEDALAFEQLPFDHPLWVLYSSGTTGLPKGIVHGQGGILLEHLKNHVLHLDLTPEDRFLWVTTTGWMMWNWVVGGLLTGSTIVLHDGSPAWPDVGGLWGVAAETGTTFLGTSAAYLTSCARAGLSPRGEHDLSALRAIGSTGSPLPPAGFEWVYGEVKEDVWLVSASGGTDVCAAFVGGVPWLPVRAGEIQAPALGDDVHAFDEDGRPVVGEVGELVITQPMPSMPVFFWNDPDGARLRDAYFSTYPGVWRHGDWVTIEPWGGIVIHGRSDSTINRQGVRIGSAEIYRVLDAIPELADTLVVGLELPDGGYHLPLYVVLAPGVELDDALRERIVRALRAEASPRHVPDEIVAVPSLPKTLNGKRLEVPVKRILAGTPVEQAVSRDAVDDAAALDRFAELGRALRARRGG
ncbi:MAG: acetoacetate--CoA ligase [Thermoleophilia bacterium]